MRKKNYLGIVIDESRTEKMSEAAQDLIKGFYCKNGETIQEALARPAVAWADDLDHAQRLYDASSLNHFMWSSPSFANAPLPGEAPIGQNISCFESETPVITKDGKKRIADLKIGDSVLTHNNNYKKILNTKTSKSSDCFLLEFQGESFVVTGNHLILTKAHDWVRVDELNPEIHEIQYIPQLERA